MRAKSFYDRDGAHHQQRADQRRDHVVLRIPFVTLPTEPVDAFPGRDDFGDDTFDNFKAATDSENNYHWQCQAPDAAPDAAKSQKQFANRKRE